MNETEVTELLERAAGSVRPRLTEPGARLAEAGRRDARTRRRRRLGAAAAHAVAAVVAVSWAPWSARLPGVVPAQRPPGGSVATFGPLSVGLPGRWQVQVGQDVDVCTAPPRTIVTGWLHRPSRCTVPSQIVLLSAEPLVVGDPSAPRHEVARDDGRSVTWQQTWIRGNLEVSRIDGYLLTAPGAGQVFVVGPPQLRDAAISGLAW